LSADRIADILQQRRSAFAPLRARVKFALEDRVVHIDATQTPPVVSGDDAAADCTIRVAAADLERLLAGKLSPTVAYTLGKLRIEGSMGLAMKLASLLDD
jgi:putative sterol carrier protein